MFDCVITGGIVVFPDISKEADIAVLNGKIAAIGTAGIFHKTKRIISAKDCFVLPGAIDPHVHVHWPFLAATTSDTYAIASRAAALGGTTSFIDFAHPRMGPTPIDRIANRRKEVGPDSILDYSLHCVISDYSEETLTQMDQLVKQGVTSFKMYMTYSRRKIMADDAIIYFVMKKAVDLGALVCVHAENGPLGDAMEERFIADGKTKAVDFPRHKPNFIEAEAVERAIFWAKQTGAKLYFFHISTKEGLDIIRDAKKEGLPIIAETCPQYLLLDDSVFTNPDSGHWFICSPPIRSRQDNEALWSGIEDGTISAIGTDHCAFTTEQKNRGINNFIDVPNGLPGIETRLSLLWSEGVFRDRINPQQLVNIVSSNPAKIFGLFPRKGCISPGSDADIVIINPDISWKLTVNQTHMGVDWSPYEEREIHGKVMHTIVRGEIIVEDGEFVGNLGGGSFIHRTKSH